MDSSVRVVLDELRGAIRRAVDELPEADRPQLISDLADFLRELTATAVDFELETEPE
jgi:hypothetical protein